MADKLDVSPLVNAVTRLREGLERLRQEPHDDMVRDGLIQRFEFAYEIAHRMLRRYLRSVAPSPEAYDQMSFQDLIRTGQEQGLLRDGWPTWRRYRDMRARTSHTYSAVIAQQVTAGIPDFLVEATHLAEKLQGRLA